ncbi:hypothetical protein Dimus_024098 [Dionaea muscipula]
MQCLSCSKCLYYRKSGAYCPTNGTSVSWPCWASYKSGCYYTTMNGPGNCKECYEEARDTAVKLKRENQELKANVDELKANVDELKANVDELKANVDELKANVDFLRLSSLSSHDDLRSSPFPSDVTLVASDDSPDSSILAHKFVLASRSPVFKAMFETEMMGSISGTINMSDVNYDLLHAFVNYLYTADVCFDEKIASNLLILAEKYQVKHLKEHCERYLVSNLNWDNSVSNYVFAYQHSARKLLEASLSIITDNMDKFMNTEYGELVKKDLSFVVGIFEAYMKKQLNIEVKKGHLRLE